MAEQTFTSGQILTAAQMTTLQTNTGLAFISNTVVGAGVSTVTVSSAFSTTYDNYKIIYSGGVGSISNVLLMTLGASTSGYYSARALARYSDGSYLGGNTNNGSAWSGVGVVSTQNVLVNIDVLNPFLAVPTFFTGNYAAAITTDAAGATGGYHTASTSFTAFTLALSAGTITGGTISVYGYRK